jgi:hypothetical protein
MTRNRVWVSVLVATVAYCSFGSSPANACCEWVTRQVWVHGRYSNAAPGDVVVNKITATSTIAPIIQAIGEGYTHAMIVADSASRVTHNVGDTNTLETGWSCSHPINPSTLRPMRPGAQSYVYPDSSLDSFQAAMVLHKAGRPACEVPPLGQPGGVGYDLYGFSHNVPNGMCVQMLNSSCGVPRPAPRHYDGNTIYAAASAMYNAIYAQASAIGKPWYVVFIGGCPGAYRYAANEVVNTFLYANPWDTNFEPWTTPVTDVVTPAQLVATYPGAKEPAGLVPGYYTSQEVRECHPGNCY